MAVAYFPHRAANPAPPVVWGCRKPGKDCCQFPEQHICWRQGGGGSNGSGRIKRYNNDNNDNNDVGLNAAAGKVVNNLLAGQGYDGQQ